MKKDLKTLTNFFLTETSNKPSPIKPLFSEISFKNKNSIRNLSTYFSIPKHKQYPTQLLNNTVLIPRTLTCT